MAQITDYASGSVTEIIDRLAGIGYVERTAYPTDRRSIHLQLTADGMSAVGQTRGFYELAFSRLSESEQRIASATLHLLTNAVVRCRESR